MDSVTPGRRQGYDGQDRRESDNGLLASLPTWVKAISVVGIPGAISCYLVWIFASTLPAMQASMQVLAAEQREVTKQIAEHMRQQDAQLRLSRWICSNTAKTEMERQRCFDQ